MTPHEYIEPLTEREADVLALIAEGLSNQAIADTLFLTHGTVKWYASQIYAKIGVKTRAEAIVRSQEMGLVDNETQPTIAPTPLVRPTLPHALTSFVGREREIDDVIVLLDSHRLITLRGTGGSGKTRLSLEIAHQVRDDYLDGVYFVALTPIEQSQYVINAIASALNIKESTSYSVLEMVESYLHDKDILIVLDNFEHVIEAAPLVAQLLQHAPRLQIVATSREVLQLSGEYDYHVKPLALPDLQKQLTLKTWQHNEALTLFEQRAQSVNANFRITRENVETVAKICHRLDGLPLAIELAAARIRMFSPEQLLERLAQPLQTLRGGFRDLPQRQQTLYDAIDWSYNLLNADEKFVFSTLGIFRGGCRLDTIEQLAPNIDDLIFVLESLLNKSLLYISNGLDDEPRFMLLETIQQYAIAQLKQTERFHELSAQHATYFTELAEEAAQHYRRHLEHVMIRRLEAEHENLMHVLEWTFGGNDEPLGLRLVAALGYFWYLSDRYTEGAYWLDKALAIGVNYDVETRIRLLMAYHSILFIKHEHEAGKAQMRELMYLGQSNDDRLAMGYALISTATFALGNVEEGASALKLAQDGVNLLRELGEPQKPLVVQGLNVLGEIARMLGDYEQASAYYEECMALLAETGEVRRKRMMHHNLGFVAQHRGDYATAHKHMSHYVRQVAQINPTGHGTIAGLTLFAGPIARQGQFAKAARIIGAAETHLKLKNATLQLGDIHEHEETVAFIIDRLGQEKYNALWQEGSQMTMLEVLDYALGEN